MPLNATQLAALIVDKVEDANLPDPPETGNDGRMTRAARIRAMTPYAEAMIEHIKNSATVTGVCPSSGGPLAQGRIR